MPNDKIPLAKYNMVKIDAAELAVRLIEAVTKMTRPEGMTAQEFIDRGSEETCGPALLAAKAAAHYFFEQLKAVAPNMEMIEVQGGKEGMN